MLFLVGSLAVGNYVALGLRMIGGVLQGRFVAPATLGLFAGIGLVMSYAPFLQLGILNGLNRELPYFIGKGDRQRVNELAAAAWPGLCSSAGWWAGAAGCGGVAIGPRRTATGRRLAYLRRPCRV